MALINLDPIMNRLNQQYWAILEELRTIRDHLDMLVAVAKDIKEIYKNNANKARS